MAEKQSLRSASASALSWSYVAMAFRYAGALVVSTFLARLLSPADFGLFALTLPVTAFAQLFSDMGFSISIVQREEMTPRMLDSIFWTSLGVGIGLFAVVSALAWPLSWVFEHPDFWWVLILAGTSFLFSTLNIVPTSLLKRRLHIREVSFCEIFGFVLGSVSAVVLAFQGYGPLSLVIQAVVPLIGKMGLAFVLARWRPTLRYSRADIQKISRFGASYTYYNISTYFTKNIDKLIIGNYFSVADLGLYNRAYTYTSLPSTMVSGVVSTAMFPVLARVRSDAARFTEYFLLINELVTLLVLPLFLGLWVLKWEFITVVLGPQWEEMVTLMDAFILIGLVQSINSLTGIIYITREKMHTLFLLAVYSAVVSSASYLVGALLGEIEYVAYSYLAVYMLLVVPPCFILPFRLIGLPMWTYLGRLKKILLAGIVMTAVLLGLEALLGDTLSSLLRLLSFPIVGAVVYAAAIWVLRPRIIDVGLDYARERYGHLLPARWRKN